MSAALTDILTRPDGSLIGMRHHQTLYSPEALAWRLAQPFPPKLPARLVRLPDGRYVLGTAAAARALWLTVRAVEKRLEPDGAAWRVRDPKPRPASNRRAVVVLPDGDRILGVRKAARLLGLRADQLYARMERHGDEWRLPR
jgi:hypothetical protein